MTESLQSLQRRLGIGAAVAMKIQAGDIVHGKTCEKKPHDKWGGYLHGEDDDTPYDVDGWKYCGRCHQVL
jgi:hypothetical protein